ncbi:MAG: hypothetical protein KF758_17580 [Anaerolineales bacterium]|nr:hypothetical protein [Anaerolineales bacterium]MBX3038727.1 hypothetical protein [Anaerolineales bacterium]
MNKAVVLFVLLLFLVSCTSNETTAIPPIENIPTVTNTISSPTEVTPKATPFPTIAISVENVFTFDEMNLAVGFDTPLGFEEGLSTSVITLTEANAPFELPYPQHARILFTAYTNGREDILADGIRIFRVEDVDALEAGILGELEAVLTGQSDHRIDFPRLPGAGSIIDSQIRLQAFQNGDGYRYLILKSFDASSLSNTQLTFLYQGLTLDQKFFVSVVAQVNAPFLQEYVNQTLTTPEEFENYFQTINEQVENADANSFEPSLNILDEMIASIVIIEK